jgi:hypothetical protein
VPAVRFDAHGRAPIDFVPYWLAGGRTHGAWRITWLSLAPEGVPE